MNLSIKFNQYVHQSYHFVHQILSMNKSTRCLAQVDVEAYLYKFAIRHKNFHKNIYRVPFSLPLSIPSNRVHVKKHFDKIKQNPSRKTLLINMFKPSMVRRYSFARWLDDQFKEQMMQLLIAGRGFSVNEKDIILQYLDMYEIEEEEYAYERAAKAWTRKKQEIQGSEEWQMVNFNFNELRKTPNRQRRRDLPSPDIQDL